MICLYDDMKKYRNDKNNFREDVHILRKLILGRFLHSHLSFRSSKKHSATWAEVPLNRKSKRFSRIQTKDNIPQRLPNVRVDVQMIENASLCISLNFHDGPTPMRAKRSLLLLRRSSFHGRKQNIRFVGILTGNFAAPTYSKFLRTLRH